MATSGCYGENFGIFVAEVEKGVPELHVRAGGGGPTQIQANSPAVLANAAVFAAGVCGLSRLRPFCQLGQFSSVPISARLPSSRSAAADIASTGASRPVQILTGAPPGG